jgi:molybdopterin/thiamine biosynthesis adenylyltransferase/nitroreductase
MTATLNGNEKEARMASLSNLLDGLRSATNDAWRPQFFDLAKDGRAPLEDLLRSGAVAFVDDTLESQLSELIASRNASRVMSPDALTAAVRDHLGSTPPESYGTWVYFPWSKRLVHILGHEEFEELRTDRNQNKITRAEQKVLRTKTVGVVGLSIGNVIAVSLAQEGVGGSFRIADFDRLSLSNLNRIRGSVDHIGVVKTSVAARQMFEMDPYLDIRCFEQGIVGASVDEFLSGLDLLFEECDDIPMKVALRERARALGVPVVMATADRGLIDIERFDREPERPLFHGLLGDIRSQGLRRLRPKEMVPFIIGILGADTVSPRSVASSTEFGRTLSSAAQLASNVTLGGGLAVDVARRILLGELTDSGRFYVDPGLIRDGAGLLRHGAPPAPSIEPSPEALGPPRMPPPPPRPGVLDESAVRYIVAHAILAPSGHNVQPWRFRFREGRLTLRNDRSVATPMLDYESCGTWLSFGAALENIALAARAIGLDAHFDTFPEAGDPDLVARVDFKPVPPTVAENFEWVTKRVTNRRSPKERTALAPELADTLQTIVARGGGKLQIRTDNDALDEIARLLGSADRIGMMNKELHRELMDGFRWTRREVETKRDGLDIWTTEMDGLGRAGLSTLKNWRAVEAIRACGGGAFLEEPAKEQLDGASAMALLTMPAFSPASFLAGGKVVQRVWFAANRAGYALHPMTVLPYFFARLERGRGEGFSEPEREELRHLRERYRKVFDVAPDEAEVFLFRLTRAEAPTARALRRNVSDLLVIE